jgi:hypothetical protein
MVIKNFILPRIELHGLLARGTILPIHLFFSYPVLTAVEFTSTALHAPIGHVEDHAEHWTAFHNRIKPTSKLSKSKSVLGPLNSCIRKSSNNKKNTSKNKITNTPTFEAVALTANQPKVSVGIDKNLILSNYEESCISKGITNQVLTMIKGENLPTYPSHHHLIANCKMKPSSDLYYWAKELHFDNVVIFVVRWPSIIYLTANNLESLRSLNKHYCIMIENVQQLQFLDFSSLKMPRLDYAKQTSISSKRVNLATACAIHYRLNIGMVIRYLKGKYIGES